MPSDGGAADADPEPRRSSPGFRLPLAWSLILAFALITLSMSSAIIFLNYKQNSNLTYGFTAQTITDVAQRLRQRVEDTLHPALVLAGDADTLAWSPEGATFGPEARRYAASFMAANPQISSVYFAAGDRDFVQIYNALPDEPFDWGGIQVPLDARFVVRHLHGDPALVRQETWTFLDSDKRLIAAPLESTRFYDPRTRPWYAPALESPGVVLTKPYAFATLNTVGITASKRVRGSVFGVDMTLTGLSRSLQDLDIADKGAAVVFTREGMVIAYPDRGKLLTPDGKGSFRPAHVKDLGDPVVEAMLAAAGVGSRAADEIAPAERTTPLDFLAGDGGLIAFDVGETHFVSHVVRLDTDIGTEAFLGIALRQSDVLEGVDGLTANSLLLSLLFLLAGTIVIVAAARGMARPICALAHETDMIRRLELDDPVETRSRVVEVHDLATAIASLKTTLKGLGRYIPRGVVTNMIREGRLPELGGASREVTVMFTDAVGFTSLSELMSPQDLMRKLSSYFEVLTTQIQLQGGTIDKYIGDSVMAVWNGLEEDPDHAVHGCRAALLCGVANDRLNDMWRSYDWPEMHTRFGLHQGEAVVGNIGSRTRMDHTTIGACVNVASRLEGLNKAYGTRILVSGAVHDAVKHRFLMRAVDLVRPLGSSQALMIFELGAEVDGDERIAATPALRRQYALWDGFHDQYQARDWTAAESLLKAYLAEFPEDRLAHLYRERLSAYASAPPVASWDGVWNVDRK